jgi:hypothetical protein
MKPLAVTASILGGLCVIVGLGWVLTANDIALTHYGQPRYEAIRRETFEQSKAYNQGMVQNLRTMQSSYVLADDDHKSALAQIILHEMADYDMDNLPPDLQVFVRSIKR